MASKRPDSELSPSTKLAEEEHEGEFRDEASDGDAVEPSMRDAQVDDEWVLSLESIHPSEDSGSNLSSLSSPFSYISNRFMTSSDTFNAAESLFECWKTASRTNHLGASLSTFVTILANLDIPGPEHLLEVNLRDRGKFIGQGAQFTVFLDKYMTELEDGPQNPRAVVKRVRIPRSSLRQNRDPESNEKYLQSLRHLELEVLGLGLIRHRNITPLTGWGYDYIDRYTPIPVLFMEAALAPLSEILDPANEVLYSLGAQAWNVKYQLALDIAAGLEAIHGFNIIHGDVKPDNMLVFRTDKPELPLVAKLSDFGVCIDIRTSGSRITPETYLGTPAWTGSEVGFLQWDDEVHGEFEPALLKHVDSYSFGLLLLSIFGTDGQPPRITMKPGPERAFMIWGEIEDILAKCKQCPDTILQKIRNVTKRLLAIRPGDRPLPSSNLLQVESPAYEKWLRVSGLPTHLGNPKRRREHGYWMKLDHLVRTSLDMQYDQVEKEGKSRRFSGEFLFGMAEAYATSSLEADWPKRVIKYIAAAAHTGYIPAKAIYGKIHEALEMPPEVDPATLIDWEREAVSDGFMFARNPFLEEHQSHEERQTFRANGGYGSDAFLSKKALLHVARNTDQLNEWFLSNSLTDAIDSAGNTMMHVCAALGEVDSITMIMERSKEIMVNEEGETPLYKACQAGHAQVVHVLLRNGHQATHSGTTSVSPLHWLFMFPDAEIAGVANALVRAARVDVNAMITPIRVSGHAHIAQRYWMSHYPFEWPLGTPFHWAAFARNKAAMGVLLDLGANINATYDTESIATTPLAQAVYTLDAPLAEYLIGKGADFTSQTSSGENLLHTTCNGAGNERTLAGKRFNSWVRHGKWENVLKAAKDVVQVLLRAGVDLEGRMIHYGAHTPTLAAVVTSYRRECVLRALLDANSDANAVETGANETVLQNWCSIESSELEYPHVYRETMRQIIRKTKNLSQKGGTEEDTALHQLARGLDSTQENLKNMTLLLSDPGHHADVNARDRHGNTPLMRACIGSRAGTMGRIQCLLKYGAKPELMNDYQENAIYYLVINYNLMDSDSLQALEYILSHDSFDCQVRDRFIAETTPEALIKACSQARPRTVEYLLRSGMGKRVNETIVKEREPTTALDEAFSAADTARLAYLKYASEILTEEERLEAERSDRIYTITNNWIRGTYGGDSPERAREQYWSYPEILKLLQSYGARRIRHKKFLDGPSFTDATKLAFLGFRTESQPNLEHWKPLYDLEVLDDGWEDQAYEHFLLEHSAYLDEDDLPELDVPVMVYERWPQVIEMLPNQDGWYRGILRDGRKVRVRLDGKKICALQTLLGRSLSIDER